jgi:hypothetical protein
LQEFVVYSENEARVLDRLPTDLHRMGLAVFGYKEGDSLLPQARLHGGIDILFSGLLACHYMKTALSPAQVCKMCALIEATIPFRQADNGVGPLDVLHDRLVQCNKDYQLDMTADEIIETVQEGADLLNRQVGNMVTDDLAVFLDHTWSLLPEENASLRKHSLYTLYEYYSAIYKMMHFLSSLDPSAICVSFRGVPEAAEIAAFSRQLSVNMRLSLIYIQARLVAVALVVAFATLTGGDAPKSLFFGDLPTYNRISERLGDDMPVLQVADDYCNLEVLDVLKGNRMADTGFDTKNAPLAAFLYSHVGDAQLSTIKARCKLAMSETDAWDLLRVTPETVVTRVGIEIGRITVSRAGKIDRILAELQGMRV